MGIRPTTRRTSLRSIRVTSRPGQRAQGWLFAGSLVVPVALGRAGIKADKREGDGGTPRGRFHPVRLWWRADRLPRPHTALPMRRIDPADAGAKIRMTAATTGPFVARPMNQATGSVATTRSTT